MTPLTRFDDQLVTRYLQSRVPDRDFIADEIDTVARFTGALPLAQGGPSGLDGFPAWRDLPADPQQSAGSPGAGPRQTRTPLRLGGPAA
jgi:hypothetical protein